MRILVGGNLTTSGFVVVVPELRRDYIRVSNSVLRVSYDKHEYERERHYSLLKAINNVKRV
jgi:hypothetical protein